MYGEEPLPLRVLRVLDEMAAEADRLAVPEVSIALKQTMAMIAAARVQGEGRLFERLLCASSCPSDKRANITLRFAERQTIDRVCTALAETRITNSVVLSLYDFRLTPETRRRMWQSIAYAFFVKHARARSSISKVDLLQVPCMTMADAEAITEVLTSDDPAYLLFGHSAGDEDNRQSGPSHHGTAFEEGVLPGGTTLRLKQMHATDALRDKSAAWLLVSDVSGVRVLDDVGGGYVRVLVPGYGVCRVSRDSVLPEPRDAGMYPARTGVVDLTILFEHEVRSVDGAARFIELVGASLTSLGVSVAEVMPPSAIRSVMRSCPKLMFLEVDGPEGCVDTATFLVVYRLPTSDSRYLPASSTTYPCCRAS